MSKYTVKEFIDTFASKVVQKFEWTLSDGQIRAPFHRSRVCPATAYYETLHDLRICDILTDLMTAADNKPGHDPEIRSALLTVCGLSEH